jgi:endonuclease/exonuclease/phosphatase (EEP) superfamily protein YafD
LQCCRRPGLVAARSCAIVAAVCLALGACGIVPVRTPFAIESSSGYPSPDLDARLLRVLVWNIHKRSGDPVWRRELRDILRNRRPHLILLQEYRLHDDGTAPLDQAAGYGWAFAPNLYQARHDAYSGVLTASTAQPLTVRPLLSNGLEPLAGSPKPMLVTAYRLQPSGASLLVANLHGINFHIGLDEFQEQLRQLVEIIKRHRGPVILAGDFNTWSPDRVERLTHSTREMGLVSTVFPEPEHIESRFGRTLDQVYYRPGAIEPVPSTADVLEQYDSSDHRPLYIELQAIRDRGKAGP